MVNDSGFNRIEKIVSVIMMCRQVQIARLLLPSNKSPYLGMAGRPKQQDRHKFFLRLANIEDKMMICPKMAKAR